VELDGDRVLIGGKSVTMLAGTIVI
jgi:hypothetical protein